MAARRSRHRVPSGTAAEPRPSGPARDRLALGGTLRVFEPGICRYCGCGRSPWPHGDEDAAPSGPDRTHPVGGVQVPAPERFAVHKLIIGHRRHDDPSGQAKAREDVLQAGKPIESLAMASRLHAVAPAFEEAWAPGPEWRRLIALGVARLPASTRRVLQGLELPFPVPAEGLRTSAAPDVGHRAAKRGRVPGKVRGGSGIADRSSSVAGLDPRDRAPGRRPETGPPPAAVGNWHRRRHGVWDRRRSPRPLAVAEPRARSRVPSC